MTRTLDFVERELERAIQIAAGHGDDGLAYELSIELKEYRQFYKVETYE